MSKAKRILVVDDLEDNRDLLSQILEGDYSVTLAPGGREAIASLERDRPDLLILDLAMPDVDGFAVLQYLAEHAGSFLPVIVISAITEREARVRALRMGAHEFVSRPFDLEEIAVRVKAMLALKEAREAAEQRARDLEVAVAERTRQLQLALEDLQKADRYKDEFLSVVSHELRTPLNAILGFTSMLDDGVAGPLTDEQHGYLTQVLQGADRMMELVSNLLDMSRMAAGRFSVDTHAEPFEPLVERALEAVRPLASRKGISVQTDLCVPEDVVLDDERTVQVLTNLVQNALKFTDQGGQVVVKAFLREGELVTEVKDTGIGIPPEELPRLFHAFAQVDMSSTREVGGSGLGLSLAKGIVEAQGGHIGVRSEPGVGSTFWFTVPAGA